MMTKEEFLSSLIHAVIGLIFQMLVAFLFWSATGSWRVGFWAGAFSAAAFSFGREHSQEERKAADRLGLNHADLWSNSGEAYRCLWPLNWGQGNRWDWYAPALAVLAVAMAVSIGGGVL
jgi:hypothetical protein